MPQPAARLSGTVARWRNTFGFIQGDDGIQYFCHHSGIVPTPGIHFRSLVPGQRVSFNVKQTDRDPLAVGIEVL